MTDRQDRALGEREPGCLARGLTWRCDTCGVEFDCFTYGGPCPEDGCTGELQHRKPKPGAPQGPVKSRGHGLPTWPIHATERRVTRVWDGFWWGLLIAVFAVIVVATGAKIIYQLGYDGGQRDDRASVERVGGGRYVEMELDGKSYRGWLR